jgi:hypothetical protein
MEDKVCDDYIIYKANILIHLPFNLNYVPYIFS